MAKYTKEMKVLSAKHLKLLLKETGIQKQELAKIAGRSAQWVTGMIKGESPVSEKTAQAIHEHFPEYSIRWLMGLDEYPNGRSEFVARINRMNSEGELMREGFYAFAKLMGYSVVLTSPASIRPDGKVDAVEAVEEIKGGYTITCGKRSACISFEGMLDLQNEIADFVDFKLGRFLKGRC